MALWLSTYWGGRAWLSGLPNRAADETAGKPVSKEAKDEPIRPGHRRRPRGDDSLRRAGAGHRAGPARRARDAGNPGDTRHAAHEQEGDEAEEDGSAQTGDAEAREPPGYRRQEGDEEEVTRSTWIAETSAAAKAFFFAVYRNKRRCIGTTRHLCNRAEPSPPANG